MRITFTILFVIASFVILEGKTNYTIEFNGADRDFKVYKPSSHYSNSPLLLVFHGRQNNLKWIWKKSGFNQLSEIEGFLVCYPETVDEQSWSSSNSLEENIEYINTLIDQLITKYNVDPNRVYATGFSEGGLFSHELACRSSSKIAAIVPINSSIELSHSNFSPEFPRSVMMINNESVIEKDNSPLLNVWIKKNSCNENPVLINRADLTEDSKTQHIIFNGDENDVSVELLKIRTGRDDWPEWASYEVWDFLSSYSRKGRIIPQVSEWNDSSVNIYPNPSSHTINLDFQNKKKRRIELVSPSGQSIFDIEIDRYHFEFPIYSQANGVYFLKIDDQTYKIIKN